MFLASTQTIVLLANLDSKTTMELVLQQLHVHQLNSNTEADVLAHAPLEHSSKDLNAREAAPITLTTKAKFVTSIVHPV